MEKIKFNKSNNVFSYWYSCVKTKGAWSIITRFAKYARRYLFISRMIKYAALIIAFIETSATLVIAASVLIIAIPLILTGFVLTLIISSVKYKRTDPVISKELEEAQKIIFIEAPKGYNRKKSAYLNRMAECFNNEGYKVIVVSRSYRCDRILCAKRTESGIWVVMLNYYFVIKRKFLENKEDKITYIY
ncbi:MAG: hypothetical protein IKU52_05400 [Clostridia bacterium]|nr:hypothetical protein [Clostridia bacterium]